MITPSFGLTATERVLPRLALDWTTGLAQPGVDVTRAGVATFVGSNGLIQSATADTQRIDWSTGTAGLLIEESRTNLVLNSEDFSAWTPTRMLVSTDASEAPDGNTTADKLIPTSTSGTHYVLQNITVVSGTAYTGYVFTKAGEYTRIRLRLQALSGSADVTSDFDLVAKTATGSGVIKEMANGYFRCSLSFTPDTTSGRIYVYGLDNTGASSFAGNDSDGIFVGGAQLEAGAFPTSYIPTEATAVTRNADVATMTGTNFSDWFNATEGAIVCTYDTAMPSGTGYAYGISNGSLSAFIGGNITTGNAGVRVDNTTNQVNLLVAPYTVNTQIKTCLGYKANSFAGAGNGLAVLTDTAGTIPTVDRMHIGSLNGVVHINGHIAKLAYYPQRIINAEVQAFSKV